MDYYLAIRFFGLFIVSLYVYWRILDINISKSKTIAAIIFSLIMSIPLSYFPPFYEFIFLGSVCLFVSVVARVKLSLMLSSVIISVGISMGIEIIAYSVVTIIEITITAIYYLITNTLLTVSIPQNRLEIFLVIIQTIVFVISVVFVNFLFKIKRLQKGILFLQDRESVWVGMIFSIIIMIYRSMSGIVLDYITDEAGTIYLTAFSLIIIAACTFGIYFWWRHNTTALYQQRIKDRDIENHINENEEKNNQIKELLKSNNLLAKSVHRDNKLIPAMYKAVDDFLRNSENTDEKTKGLSILSELEELMQERKNMVLKTQMKNKKLPSVKIERIDNILNYMYLRATENDMEFDVILNGDIRNICERIISKSKLETLLADLIENAIIATTYSEYKRILVTIGLVNDCLEITVQDSGIPFETETLTKLGVEKSTTHADTGGSGIGYITIFEIINESAASLTITECVPKKHSLVKTVTVRFDEKSEYIVNTFRH